MRHHPFDSLTSRSVPSRLTLGGTLLLLLSAACTTGQIGGEVDVDDREGDDASGDACVVEAERALEADEDTGLGFSSSSVMAAVAGTFEVEAEFGIEPGAPEEVELSPEAGATTLTLTVTPIEGSAKVVERNQRAYDSHDGEEVAADYDEEDCRDQLQFEADVTVETENGALRETFRATFVSEDGVLVSTSIPVDLEALEGTLALDASELENAEIKQLRLSAQFALGSVRGELSGVVEQDLGDAVSGGGLSVLRFPEGGCEYGFELDAESEAGEALSDALLSHTTFSFTFDGAEPTPMTVTPELGRMCFEPSFQEGGGSVRAPLSLGVVTEDGRIDGTFELVVQLSLQEDGTPVYVNVYRDGYLGNVIPAGDFESVTGITGIESTAAYLSFSFGYGIDLLDDLPIFGEITIMEIIASDCGSQEPVEEEGGGASSPGCAGDDVMEREMGTFREALPN